MLQELECNKRCCKEKRVFLASGILGCEELTLGSSL